MWRIRNIEIHNQVVVGPMAGVSNIAFRSVAKEFGAGLIYTEMVSDKAIVYQNERTLLMTEVDPNEHPLSMQLFGEDIESMVKAAIYLDTKTDCDIIDINMGCPVNKIVKGNGGASLMKTPLHAATIVKEIVKHVSKPVTVKIRAGWDVHSKNAVEMAQLLEEAGASAIAIHGRTRSQMYEGSVDWDIIRDVKQVVNIPVIGNGNIFDAKKHGVDIEIISATKYLSGGGHVLGGLIVDNGTFNWKQHATLEPYYKKFGPNAFMARLRKETFRNLGSTLSAQSAYLLCLGLETLDLRVRRSCQNALSVAKYLQNKAQIIRVDYPLLETSSSYENASKQFSGGGAIVTFSLENKEKAYAFLNALKLIRRGTNIQDNKSLAIAPYHTIYAEYSEEQRLSYQLTQGMIRLSVGIEDIEDLLGDIDQALG